MKNFGRALKAGVRGFVKAFEPARYSAAGLPISCPHCKGDVFKEKEALLNTTGGTLVGMDWLDQSGSALVCEKCGLIQWYGKRPEKRQG